MKVSLLGLCAGACAVALVACSKSPSAPTAPSAVVPAGAATDAAAAADGSTLKVTAPVPQSPINNARPAASDSVVLVVGNSAAKFASNIPVFYHFQVFNAGGGNVVDAANIPAGAGTTSYQVTAALDGDQVYSWRARVEAGGGAGPWSTTNSFIAPQNDGYIRGSELYDPLSNGKTVGRLVGGPFSWVPGVGLRILAQTAYVRYQLDSTLTEGEFSLITSDMDKNTDGGKTKLFAMAQGDEDIVTNDRRMTVEKRGDPAGVVAWRFITHDDQVDTEGPAERIEVNFDRSKAYFWRASWRNNVFRLTIQEGGSDGRQIYNMGKSFQGRPYDPTPHVIYLGSPIGRSGEDGASVDNVTYRQVWVSGRARPSFANK